jgi:hypothetical protein
MEFNKHVCKNNTALFNEAIFNAIIDGYYTLDFDQQHLIRSLETILYPGTPIKIIKDVYVQKIHFLQIESKDYPSKNKLYIQAHNAKMGKATLRAMPALNKIQLNLRGLKDIPYFWGGTLPYGLEKKRGFAVNGKSYTPFEKKCLNFEGLDCSGLLYYVTNGYTPRNTGDLMTFGKPCRDLKPLDLILWPGHVVLILDDKHTIESREIDGLITEPLEKRLDEIRAKRKWVEKINPHTLDKNIYTTRRFL